MPNERRFCGIARLSPAKLQSELLLSACIHRPQEALRWTEQAVDIPAYCSDALALQAGLYLEKRDYHRAKQVGPFSAAHIAMLSWHFLLLAQCCIVCWVGSAVL